MCETRPLLWRWHQAPQPAVGTTRRVPEPRGARGSAKPAPAAAEPPPHTGHRCIAPRRARRPRPGGSSRRSPRAGWDRIGQTRLRRLPVLRSLAGTSSLRPAGRARRDGGGSEWEAAKERRLPPSPRDHPAAGAVVAAESGSAAFVTPPLAVARCWGARAAAASPFFCCCWLQ